MMKKFLFLDQLNREIESKYTDNSVYQWLNLVCSSYRSEKKDMIIRSGELFYCCMCFIDEMRGRDYQFIKQKCFMAWDNISQYLNDKGFSLQNEDVHFCIGLILYSTERVLALIEDCGYFSQLIETNLIKYASAHTFSLQQHFDLYYRTAGKVVMQEWFSDYLDSEQIISDDIEQMAELIKQQPKAKRKSIQQNSRSQNVKPYTIHYICPNQASRNQRLQFLLRAWVKWEWIEDVKTFDDFDSFFIGDERECNLKWVGSSQAILYYLLQKILKQSFVKKQKNVSARSIVRGQFHIDNIRANHSRLSDEDKSKVAISVCILSPQQPLPQSKLMPDNQPDVSLAALQEVYAKELSITKDLNKQY